MSAGDDMKALRARIETLEQDLERARAELARLRVQARDEAERSGDGPAVLPPAATAPPAIPPLDAAALRALYGEPSIFGARKVMARLDVHARRFVSLSPFLCISSAAGDGRADVSPRGDAPGFVHVLDERTLVIPDRPGNNRLDTMQNLLGNPHVGLLFLIPGRDEVLRMNGTASIAREPELLERLAAQGKLPKAALRVRVDEVFLHCGKAIKRARLWDPKSFVGDDALPSLGRMLAEQIAAAELPVEEAERRIAESYRTRMY
jgi:PPOX class probable FMN-dependent enzyme